MEPDRWEEERRRGLTIDLGFAWTMLASGRQVAFVDVPGHYRFLGNTLAGLGPAPVVCFVVAADEGWQAQSSDHRDALAALGIRLGLIVITRADRAPGHAAEQALEQARAELAETGLRDAPGVIVSAVDGSGLAELRAVLDRVLAQLPPPETTARLRLWVDRSFTITGAGTVVTGTLAAGALATGDRLDLLGAQRTRSVVIRGLESRGEPYSHLGPVARVALNLRGVSRDAVHRGDALVTPGAWPSTRILDVRRVTGNPLTESPAQLIVHVGTAAVPARLRPFDDEHGRLTLDRRLPLVLGDRLILRYPGGSHALAGAQVLDAEPPPLRRRGDAARRAAALAGLDPRGDLTAEVARRGAVQEDHLRRLGLLADQAEPPAAVRVIDGWWVHGATYDGWQRRLRTAVNELHARDPLVDGLSRGAARDLLGIPDESLLDVVARDAGLEQGDGHIRKPGIRDDLGAAEAAVAELEARLTTEPFRAPEADELSALRLGPRELAAAERAGRVLRLRDGSQAGLVLLPTAPALAMRTLAALDQPFTTSQARQALCSTRRVAIPLLEHLDARGWTRRLDAGHREVVRRRQG